MIILIHSSKSMETRLFTKMSGRGIRKIFNVTDVSHDLSTERLEQICNNLYYDSS